jgi:hypothetical protein
MNLLQEKKSLTDCSYTEGLLLIYNIQEVPLKTGLMNAGH